MPTWPLALGVWTWSELKWQSWEGGQDFWCLQSLSIQDWKSQTPDWYSSPTSAEILDKGGSEAGSTAVCPQSQLYPLLAV